MTEVRDFSDPKTVRFKLDHVNGEEEFFDGVPGLPALALIEMAGIFEKMDTSEIGEDADSFTAALKIFLTDESAERFITRLSSKTDPISITQLMDVLPWLMEQYGMRPTPPSGASSDSSESPDGGTSSTPSLPSQVSTSSPALQTVS